jgi:hypothetical protein
MRPFLIAALLLIIIPPAPSRAAKSPLVQRQWMHNLVDALGWSYGLPDEPEDADYERILAGDRSFHFEAEAVVDENDVVAIHRLHNFGPYSGTGWVGGIAEPTVAHLRFLLPLAGSYRLSARLLLPGHSLRIGDQSFPADGGRKFVDVPVAEVPLAAGKQTIADLLPPGGGIDAIDLEAPPMTEIRPLGGWHPDRPLSLDDLAVTSVRLLNLEPLLPPGPEQLVIEAESAVTGSGFRILDARFLGEPSGGRWVRAGAEKTRIRLEFEVPKAAAYRLGLRAVAPGPLSGLLDGRQPLEIVPGPTLADHPAGTAFLTAGRHVLELDLEPRGGVDSLLLAPLASAPADYRRLAGLPTTDAAPTPHQVDRLLKLLAAVGGSR